MSKDYSKFNLPVHKVVKIEFIGPSGIGKTTLMNSVLGLYKNKSVRILNQIAPSRSEFLILKNDLNDCYNLLLQKKMDYLYNSQINIADKFCLSYFYLDLVLLDTWLNQIKEEYIVFIDEGIVHNFNNEFLGYNDHDNLFCNRVVIFCDSSPELVLDRIKLRQSQRGSLRTFHKNKAERELLIEISKEFKTNELLLESFRTKLYSVISIDMSADLISNSKKIINHIENIF